MSKSSNNNYSRKKKADGIPELMPIEADFLTVSQTTGVLGLFPFNVNHMCFPLIMPFLTWPQLPKLRRDHMEFLHNNT